jgi:two-component system, NtrC family, response regulator AtoC
VRLGVVPQRDAGAPQLQLAVVAGDGMRVVALAPGTMTIGRAEDGDIVIDDPSVSRRHALLHVGDELTIEDLGGANGTRIRHAQPDTESGRTRELRTVVRDKVVIAPGDCISLGSVMLVVRHVSPSGPAADDDGIGSDEAMRAVLAQAHRAATSRVSILLLGETGVGKEVIARSIHARSPRAAKPFVPLHCAAIAPTLFESELFGHEKGAFTGATALRPGLLETADGGTVFLDEVGEMPLEIQAKLLRVLEDRRVQRVGGRTPVPLDLRFLAATHRDLEAACTAGSFREDLFFRLNTLTITIPPLRERPADLLPLARHFALQAFSDLERSDEPVLGEAFSSALERHDWPGNVRELRNVIERAAVLCDGDTLRLEHLPPRLAARGAEPSSRRATGAGRATAAGRADVERAADARDAERHRESDGERERILFALERAAGNQKEAARLLGISRRTLITRIEQHGLPRPRKKS